MNNFETKYELINKDGEVITLSSMPNRIKGYIAVRDNILNYSLTSHADMRMQERDISRDSVELAISIGRKFYTKGALFFYIGKKEVKKFINVIPNIKKDEGIVVVCSSEENFIKTTYRSFTLMKEIKKGNKRNKKSRYC